MTDKEQRDARRSRLIEIIRTNSTGSEEKESLLLALQEVFELVDAIHKISYNIDLIQTDLAGKVFLHD